MTKTKSKKSKSKARQRAEAKFERDARTAAILSLEDANGRIRPRDLVNAARDPNHPCHNEFIWDDGIAAEKYRIDQARKILVRLKLVKMEVEVSAPGIGYVRDQRLPADVAGYVSTRVLRTEKEAARMSLQHEVDQLQAQIERIHDVARMLDLESEVPAMINAVLSNYRPRIRRGRPATRTEDELRV